MSVTNFMEVVSFMLIVHILFFVTGCLGLTRVRMNAPEAVLLGDRVRLECNYDLEGDKLYTVKWYKDNLEFYGFTPRDDPQIKYFSIKGVRVLLDASNETSVLLDDVDIYASGVYSCEVTADAPSFFVKMVSSHLHVIEIPKHDPELVGVKARYRPNEILTAECVCKESRVRVNFTWWINDKLAKPLHVRHSNAVLINSKSFLRKQLRDGMFVDGRLKIRCEATIFDVYYRSVEKIIALAVPSITTEATTTNSIIWQVMFPTEVKTHNSATTRNSTYFYFILFLFLLKLN